MATIDKETIQKAIDKAGGVTRLAHALNIGESSINRWRNGKNINKRHLAIIYKYLEQSPTNFAISSIDETLNSILQAMQIINKSTFDRMDALRKTFQLHDYVLFMVFILQATATALLVMK